MSNVQQRIDDIVKNHRVVLFMKGVPESERGVPAGVVRAAMRRHDAGSGPFRAAGRSLMDKRHLVRWSVTLLVLALAGTLVAAGFMRARGPGATAAASGPAAPDASGAVGR